MYEENKNNNQNSVPDAQDNSAGDRPAQPRETYQWNNPAPDSGAYRAGPMPRETFRIPMSHTATHCDTHDSTYQDARSQSDDSSAVPHRPAEYIHAEQVSSVPGADGTSHIPHHSHSGGEKRASHGMVKVAAVALVCALIGGGVGSSITTLASSGHGSSATVAVSDRTVGTVNEVSVNGKSELSNAENYAANVNAVVSINVSENSTNFFGQTVEEASSGSGFAITSDGYIVTNYHVISGATSISVTTYDGTTYDGTVVGGDEDYDIAVVKIDAANLATVVIGNSDSVNVGDNIIAIGNPLGELTFSMSSGSVSSCNRAVNVDGTPFNMIQVDCAINPGNSGGPLLNSYGEVIGIVSAKYSSYSTTTVEGVGFAIPINDVYAMVKDIMTNGYVTDNPYLGITGGTIDSSLAAQYRLASDSGVYVYSVDTDGAAAKCGIQAGDIIVKLDDTDITSMSDLLAAKKSYRAGDTAKMTVLRNGQQVAIDLTFGTAPQDTADTGNTDNSSTQPTDPFSQYGLPNNGSQYYYYYGSQNGAGSSDYGA